jgi:hypothetical protein
MSPNELHKPMLITPSLKLITHKNKKTTHFNSPLIASQVLQRTTTPLHMIHLVNSIDYGCFLKFPVIKVLSHEMQATFTYKSTQHTHIEKDF